MSTYTRIRNKNGSYSRNVMKYSNAPSGNYPSNTVFATAVASGGVDRLIWDNPHPGYAKAKAAGAIIQGDCYIHETSYDCSDGTFTVGPFSDWGISELTGPLAAMTGTVVGSSELDSLGVTALNIAVNAAFANMNSAPLMAGEIASDYKQTLSMLRKPFSGAADLTRKIFSAKKRRLKLKSNLNDATAFTGAWLEYRYGWKPLIFDCESAMEEIRRNAEKNKRQRLVARSSCSRSYTKKVVFNRVNFGTWPYLASSGTAVGSGQIDAHAGVIYETVLSHDPRKALVTSLGLLPKDVPSTIWEVIPYSFVVDWFVGVGDWISATTPNANVSVLGSWCTRIKSWTSTCSPMLSNPSPSSEHVGPITGSAGTFTRSDRSMQRDVKVGPSTLPPIKGINLSIVQTVDALSLSCDRVVRSLRELKH